MDDSVIRVSPLRRPYDFRTTTLTRRPDYRALYRKMYGSDDLSEEDSSDEDWLSTSSSEDDEVESSEELYENANLGLKQLSLSCARDRTGD